MKHKLHTMLDICTCTRCFFIHEEEIADGNESIDAVMYPRMTDMVTTCTMMLTVLAANKRMEATWSSVLNLPDVASALAFVAMAMLKYTRHRIHNSQDHTNTLPTGTGSTIACVYKRMTVCVYKQDQQLSLC